MLLLALDSKTATGTSLAAIGVTACAGAFSFSLFDHVHWDSAALVGLPALAGSLAGLRLQRRISSTLLTRLFAGFIVAVAVLLFLE